MKKLLLLTSFVISLITGLNFRASSQAVIDLNFDGYNGTAQTVPAGYYFSWNNTTSNSFYTSVGNFGASAPSYKFGNDGDFIVTPKVTNADSLSFWSKGNGSPFSGLNEIRVYHSIDSISWILDATLTPLSASANTMSVALSQQTGYFKIEYFKSPAGGNLAFDDLKIYSNIPIGLNSTPKQNEITVYPAPTTGLLNIKMGNNNAVAPSVEVFDMLGNVVKGIHLERKGQSNYTIDLTGKNKGYYFVKINDSGQFVTKRITLIN